LGPGNLTAAIGKPNPIIAVAPEPEPEPVAVAPIIDPSPSPAAAVSTFSGYYLYNCGTHCGFLNHDDLWQDFGSIPMRDAVDTW
jgi:hypothetical protein